MNADGTWVIKTTKIDISAIPEDAMVLVVGTAYTNVYAQLSWSYSISQTAYYEYSINGKTLTITGHLYDRSSGWYLNTPDTSDDIYRGTSSNLNGSVYYVTVSS